MIFMGTKKKNQILTLLLGNTALLYVVAYGEFFTTGEEKLFGLYFYRINSTYTYYYYYRLNIILHLRHTTAIY